MVHCEYEAAMILSGASENLRKKWLEIDKKIDSVEAKKNSFLHSNRI